MWENGGKAIITPNRARSAKNREDQKGLENIEI